MAMRTAHHLEREFDELVESDLPAATELAQRLLDKCRNATVAASVNVDQRVQQEWNERIDKMKGRNS